MTPRYVIFYISLLLRVCYAHTLSLALFIQISPVCSFFRVRDQVSHLLNHQTNVKGI
jgi:hypothetical protein